MSQNNNFGSMVFGNRTMQERLPREVYRRMRKTMEEGKSLDPAIAGVVANAMKDWAIEKGVTHYTHWFQPMNGVTAEKHDSFISPSGDGGVIMEFSGKELIQGEPDASSFPSGGLRATFEARGYTAWDPTSYAFIKDGTLCIPTAFCSYGGQALDMKTPLLRSMELIGKQALRMLRLLGDNVTARVSTTVGPEQEYFLIDKSMFDMRKDIKYCGRTLFGAKSVKGQELDDHYFGAQRPRVIAFTHELNEELWKLGILAKTEHNETAPAQHELAPIFSTTNIATDHNQLTMETMKKVADRHGMACLLHEKPFEGVNGSGKHNNWSLCTDSGENLLEPGENPAENDRFLLFLCAVIAAVDDYQDLLRISIASASNDHRLGAHEAPPAIVSIFLGEDITAVLKALEEGKDYEAQRGKIMKMGVHTMARFTQDNTDRNRTSPFAFTGNKFEFRMPGSSFSVSGPNCTLNTIVAEKIGQYSDRLEEGRSVSDIVKDTLRKHSRIIFNGNNYAESWVAEAERRGLLNLRTTADALPHLVAPKNVELYSKFNIFTEEELHSRYEILTESYCKTLRIEALTMIEIARRDIVPAVSRYTAELAGALVSKRQLLPTLACRAETEIVVTLTDGLDKLLDRVHELENRMNLCRTLDDDPHRQSECYRDNILPAMEQLREAADALEPLVGAEHWPMPTYSEILFSV